MLCKIYFIYLLIAFAFAKTIRLKYDTYYLIHIKSSNTQNNKKDSKSFVFISDQKMALSEPIDILLHKALSATSFDRFWKP